MKMLDKNLIDAAVKAFKSNIPFALFAFPGDDNFQFFVNPSFPETGENKSESRFFITPWLGRLSESLIISDEMNCADFISSDVAEMNPCMVTPYNETTDYEEYKSGLSKLIDILKVRGGKMVFSRTFCGKWNNLDVEKLMKMQFDAFPTTFRFFYYTPQTGAWIGTTPELFMNVDYKSERFKVMSLAGTKRVDENLPWDIKTKKEQSYVTEFIKETLTNHGMDFEVKPAMDVVFTPVVHICDIIEGNLTNDMFEEVFDALNPTPALCGYPVEDAVREISFFEKHPRRCYGGVVGVCDGNGLSSYVNLRSMNISADSFCIYAGGGITADSVPEAEWVETLNKTEVLRRNIDECCKVV